MQLVWSKLNQDNTLLVVMILKKVTKRNTECEFIKEASEEPV